jgi:hypothetical protein
MREITMPTMPELVSVPVFEKTHTHVDMLPVIEVKACYCRVCTGEIITLMLTAPENAYITAFSNCTVDDVISAYVEKIWSHGGGRRSFVFVFANEDQDSRKTLRNIGICDDAIISLREVEGTERCDWKKWRFYAKLAAYALVWILVLLVLYLVPTCDNMFLKLKSDSTDCIVKFVGSIAILMSCFILVLLLAAICSGPIDIFYN